MYIAYQVFLFPIDAKLIVCSLTVNQKGSSIQDLNRKFQTIPKLRHFSHNKFLQPIDCQQIPLVRAHRPQVYTIKKGISEYCYTSYTLYIIILNKISELTLPQEFVPFFTGTGLKTGKKKIKFEPFFYTDPINGKWPFFTGCKYR